MSLNGFRREIGFVFCIIGLFLGSASGQNRGPDESRSGLQNSNPNYAKVREYGHIEWHGSTARLVAGSSRPLDMAAQTLSSCLGISMSAEDPRYNWIGDLLEVTPPEWSANHPNKHMYEAKPGRVVVSFEVGHDGLPISVAGLLEDAVKQVNQQQPWHFRVQHEVLQGHEFFTFVPTASHNSSGQLEETTSWLEDLITIQPKTAPVSTIANDLANALSSSSGFRFGCCEPIIIGHPWGSQTIRYEATKREGRRILEDLMLAARGATSFVQRCQPLDKEFCFISLHPTMNRVPTTELQSGTCTALGYDPE